MLTDSQENHSTLESNKLSPMISTKVSTQIKEVLDSMMTLKVIDQNHLDATSEYHEKSIKATLPDSDGASIFASSEQASPT